MCPIISSKKSVASSKPTWIARNEIRKYRAIGRASCQVYEALRKACTKHTEHLAHFRLEVENITLREETSSQVKFDMAFTHRAFTGNLGSGDPIWFLVDSIIIEHVDRCSDGQVDCLNQLENSLKRQLEPASTPVAKKTKKSVRFTALEPTPEQMPCLSLSTSNLAREDCSGKDFCDLIRRRFRQPLQANTCVVLEDTAQCKHLVYPSPSTVASKSRKATSLEQLVTSKKAPGVMSGILIHERIALAKMLAIAVLQYHATPWLQLSWRSQDVLFFEVEGNERMQGAPDLSMPYINAKIQGQSMHVLTQPQSALARNSVLFSLGVVLLELAYGASLESLQRPCDTENGQLHSEFFTARRLARLKNSIMGATYNNIIEQLVEGVFPCSDDLDNPVLQTRYYEDVICPLDELERDFRTLCVGGPE